VLKAFDQFPVDALNLSANDLPFIAPLLAKADPQPALKRLVSANILSQSAMIAPQKFIVREISARQGKPFRVALVGLTDADAAPPPGFRIADPIEAARAVIPEARKKADMVIALAHVKTEVAIRLAREVAGLDAVIAGNSRGPDQPFTPPLKIGQTMIAFTPYETRMLGELRIYRDAQGKFSSRARFILLDEVIANDQAGLEAAAATTRAERDAREQGKKMLESWAAVAARNKMTAGGNQSKTGFASASRCAECHMAQFIQWSNNKHSRAADRLVSKPYEFDTSCLDCHGSLIEKEGELPLFADVECEQCHGPAAEHIVKPAKGYGRISDMKSLCSSCHTSKTSPNFDPQTAWLKIKH
jgi:2',3'-cyclic-nucleotide 2'-phosphodiesterase (5'-nucleotidase family)